jgi:hypothetical protein
VIGFEMDNNNNIYNIMERIIDICNSPEIGINIWFIINGIRPAYWLDTYTIKRKKKMEELLDELKKYDFIGYKFLEEYNKNDLYFPEGPLIYNKKMLNKKDVKLIEKSGLNFYHTKKFGELLGYGKCARTLKKNGLREIVIDFDIYKVDKSSTYQGQLFGIGCIPKLVNTKYYFDLFVKMNKLLKGSKYSISLSYG